MAPTLQVSVFSTPYLASTYSRGAKSAWSSSHAVSRAPPAIFAHRFPVTHTRLLDRCQRAHYSTPNMAPRRDIHVSTKRSSTSPAISRASHQEAAEQASPLSVLPLRMVLRSAVINTISSSPLLLPPAIAILSRLAHTTNPFLNPDKNPLLRYFLKKTFYAQFCAGENPVEVRRTVGRLKDIGFTGVILGYAREVVLSEAQTQDLASCGEGAQAEECIRTEIRPWAEGTLETVRLAQRGDFVALKFTGAGRQALYHLSEGLPPSADLGRAIDEICELAVDRGVRLLFDAEQQAVQRGIDAWTLDYMRKYNTAPGDAVIYGTYQAYLKSTPQTLMNHLNAAQAEGFTLGVKLVRGAYLGSDPRALIHDTKDATDAAYNGIAESLLTRSWTGPITGSGPYANVSLVLASHNADSVRLARSICESGQARTPVAFAQLQGMADEVSCELVYSQTTAGPAAKDSHVTEAAVGRNPVQAYKYLVWGSTGECMKYLLRRAQENRDAVQRTKSGRDAMWTETMRRMKRV